MNSKGNTSNNISTTGITPSNTTTTTTITPSNSNNFANRPNSQSNLNSYANAIKKQ